MACFRSLKNVLLLTPSTAGHCLTSVPVLLSASLTGSVPAAIYCMIYTDCAPHTAPLWKTQTAYKVIGLKSWLHNMGPSWSTTKVQYGPPDVPSKKIRNISVNPEFCFHNGACPAATAQTLWLHTTSCLSAFMYCKVFLFSQLTDQT